MVSKLDVELKLLESNINDLNNRLRYLRTELSEKNLKTYTTLMRTTYGKSTVDGKVSYRNWWYTAPDYMWFSRFLKHKFKDVNYKINFFSVNGGTHESLTEELLGNKVFFTGECLNKNTMVTYFNEEFGSHALDYVDFAMGFDLINNPKYLRFPLWIILNFEPDMSEEDIEKVIVNWNSLNLEKSKNVSVVASHDRWNSRTTICSDVEKFISIDYAGRWRNNTSDLHVKFNNNKLNFLKQYQFNICAENVDDTGYVTEKIFDAFKTDCIPLYIGGGEYLDPKIINHNKVLRWYIDGDNTDTIEHFKNLITDEKSLKEFRDQNYVLENSYKYVFKKFNELEKHFERLIYG